MLPLDQQVVARLPRDNMSCGSHISGIVEDISASKELDRVAGIDDDLSPRCEGTPRKVVAPLQNYSPVLGTNHSNPAVDKFLS